jgi:hypothetical protein
MIVASFGQIEPISGHDPGNGRPDSEMNQPSTERVWQTVTVTSGRIIIGWRVGT